MIACGEYLVAQHYTTPQRQAIEGGSMGGILMGRTLDERPDLFAAVHIAVGMVNPLRTLAAENGANQIGELGDPSTEAGYKSILAYDPYLNVKPQTAYPAVIFTIGLNDHRVAPWMTGKMAARLRATTTSAHPILVRVEEDAGHGIGSTRDQGFAETADVWAFLLHAVRRVAVSSELRSPSPGDGTVPRTGHAPRGYRWHRPRTTARDVAAVVRRSRHRHRWRQGQGRRWLVDRGDPPLAGELRATAREPRARTSRPSSASAASGGCGKHSK